MPRSTTKKPRASTSSARSTRPRRSVSYKEPNEGSDSSSSSEEEDDQDPSQREPADESDGEEEDEQVKSSQQSSASKRAPRGQKKRRSVALGTRKSRAKKQQQSLSGILKLPLDVLCTIFSAGDLQSLFQLTRVNKELRKHLFDPQWIGVWKSCWKNSGLPNSIDFSPPSGLSIYKWTNLLFGECQRCGGKTSNVEPDLRIKCCAQPKSCLTSLTVHQSRLTEAQATVANQAASAKTNASRLIYLLSDLNDAMDALEASNLISASTSTSTSDESGQEAAAPESEDEPVQAAVQDPAPEEEQEVGQEVAQVPGDQSEQQAGEEPRQEVAKEPPRPEIVEAASSGIFKHSRYGEILLKEFSETVPKYLTKQREEGKAIHEWIVEEKARQADAKHAVNRQRVADIKSRFTAMGFEEQHFADHRFTEDKRVRAARPLTEKTWPAIRDALLPILEENRQILLDRELAPLRAERYSELTRQHRQLCKDSDAAKEAGLFPLTSFENYGTLETFKNLWYPAEARVGPTTFADHGFEIAQELQEVKESKFEVFFDILRRRIFEHALTEDGDPAIPFLPEMKSSSEEYSTQEKKEILNSTLAIFNCVLCRHIDTFPKILDHYCSSGPDAPFAPFGAFAYYVNIPTIVGVAQTLSICLGSISLDNLSGPITRPSDVLQVPHEELEKLGNGFSCKTCPVPSFDSLARSWIGITAHHLKWQHTSAAHDTRIDDQIVYEPPAVAQLRLLKAHEDYHNDQRGAYTPPIE
ncbi:F-box protein [Sporobolomyces salmoneus]|uniref:F-box protein n=1 Tax=Sporobolomyces salmoneus TaxID=183962 RepID=UPI00317A3465